MARPHSAETTASLEPFDWPAARTGLATGDLAPAEVTCAFVASHVRRSAGARWLQAARIPPLRVRPDAPAAVRLIAERHLLRVPNAVARALVGWANGERPCELRLDAPTPREMLALQAAGRRCVSLLEGGADPLAFAVHDLCHLEKFFDAAHHHAQVGFFRAVHRALGDARWADLEAGLDATWAKELDHVIADMNGAGVFLYVGLKSRLKLGAHRLTASPTAGAALFAERLELLLDLLGLEGDARCAARALSSRRDVAAAIRLEEWFRDAGMAAG